MIPNSDNGGYTRPKTYAAPYSHPNANNSRPSYGSSGGGYTGNNGGYNVPGPNVSQRTYGAPTHITGPSAAQIRAQQGQSAAADARTAAAYARSLKYNTNWGMGVPASNSPKQGPWVLGPNGQIPPQPGSGGGPGGISPSLPGAGGNGTFGPGSGPVSGNIGLPLVNGNGQAGGGAGGMPSLPSGGGSGIPGGGQGGPSGTFTIPKAPKTPGLDTYLKSDANYQNQLRTFAQALAEFQAGQTRTTAQDNTSWQGATRQLGDQKVKDLAGIMNDFASRGMLKSGLYGQGVADYTKTYQNNLNDLNTGHSNALRDLSTANTNFQKDQAIQSAQARADAAARRAAQFGL